MRPIKKCVETKGEGRRFAIGDIHGCAKTLKALLFDKIKIEKSDQIFLLGDYVDRGKRSAKVLDTIISLIDKGYEIHPLRGNHEQTLLDYQEDEYRFFKWHMRKGGMLDMIKNKRLKKRYQNLIVSLPHYIKLDDYILVHAGIDFSKEKPFDDADVMLWFRDLSEENLPEDLDQRIVFGHTPYHKDYIIDKAKKKAKCIPIDNGACYARKHRLYEKFEIGNLCALNLDTFELLFQKNID